MKTDRRDATMLAKLHRAGGLTAIWVPDHAHEAMRDLVRARSTAVRMLGKARQHLQGFLLRHNLLRLRRLCRLGWSAAGNAPRRASPAPRRSRMLRGHRSQPIPAPRTTPHIATPLSRRMAHRFCSRKRRCCWRLGSPNSRASPGTRAGIWATNSPRERNTASWLSAALCRSRSPAPPLLPAHR